MVIYKKILSLCKSCWYLIGDKSLFTLNLTLRTKCISFSNFAYQKSVFNQLPIKDLLIIFRSIVLLISHKILLINLWCFYAHYPLYIQFNFTSMVHTFYTSRFRTRPFFFPFLTRKREVYVEKITINILIQKLLVFMPSLLIMDCKYKNEMKHESIWRRNFDQALMDYLRH